MARNGLVTVSGESGGALLKVVLIGAGLMLVAGVVATAGLIYVGYRVKNAVETKVREQAGGSAASSTARVSEAAGAAAVVQRPDVCSLLTRQEASDILGVAVERAESKAGAGDATCAYYIKPVSQQQRAASLADAFVSAAKNGGEVPKGKENDPAAIMRHTGMEGILKRVGTLANPDAPYLTVSVNWENGPAALSMLKGTVGALSPGLKSTETLSGIGDEALMGPADSMLVFVKGRIGVTLGLSVVPEGRDKGMAIARKVAGRL